VRRDYEKIERKFLKEYPELARVYTSEHPAYIERAQARRFRDEQVREAEIACAIEMRNIDREDDRKIQVFPPIFDCSNRS
jgi:hypothetical protein